MVIVSPTNKTDYSDYAVYGTYDQSSIKKEALELTPEEQFLEFLQEWGLFITLVILAVASIIALIDYLLRKSRYRRIAYMDNYMSLITSVYNTYHQNRDYCLKRLDELQREITQLFKTGKINENKYLR